jgi:small membrane protein
MFYLFSQVFSVLLAAIAISKSYVDFRSRQESLQIFLFWIITWTMIVIVALFPSIIDVLINAFGGGRTGLGTFFGMALVFLYFVVYRVYVKIERMDQKLTKMVQELALREEWHVPARKATIRKS